eukprot:1140640-Pelagomonas_calceolata.AAC.10
MNRQGTTTAGNGKRPETPSKRSSRQMQSANAAFLDEHTILCAREQCVQLNFVRFPSGAPEEYGVVCLAHLHVKKQCSYPAAALLQAACACDCTSQRI